MYNGTELAPVCPKNLKILQDRTYRLCFTLLILHEGIDGHVHITNWAIDPFATVQALHLGLGGPSVLLISDQLFVPSSSSFILDSWSPFRQHIWLSVLFTFPVLDVESNTANR